MVSYYDHHTGTVPRPVILVNKKTDDAHDNPVMSIDGKGHLWIFSNSHGTTRPSFIWKSREPYSIDTFDLVETTNFSYGHIFFLPDEGFLSCTLSIATAGAACSGQQAKTAHDGKRHRS